MYIFLMILLLLMPIPIYLGFRSLFGDKHRQKVYLTLKEAFKRLIKRHRLSITEVNIFGNSLIAMDRKMNKLVLVVYKNGITWEKCINLHEMIFCKIVKTANKAAGCIQKVNLELSFHKDGIITFAFFDEEVDDLRDLP